VPSYFILFPRDGWHREALMLGTSRYHPLAAKAWFDMKKEEHFMLQTSCKNYPKRLRLLALALALICSALPGGCKKSARSVGQSGVFSKISSEDLLSKINRTDWAILDTRPKASFNGWQLFGENAKGHIKGAISFPSAWI